MAFTYKGIDVMKKTKDIITAQLTTAEKQNLVACLASAGAKSIAISTPMDIQSQLISFGTTPSPRTISAEVQDWCDVIHAQTSRYADPLNVLHRGTFCGCENIWSAPFIDGGLPIGTAASAPTDSTATLAGRFYLYLFTNVGVNRVINGDIFAPIPEGTTHAFDGHYWWPGGTQANYVLAYDVLHDVLDLFAAASGKTLIFQTHDNFSELASGWMPAGRFSDQNLAAADYYGQRQGSTKVTPADYVYDWKQLYLGKDSNGGGNNGAGGYPQVWGEWGDLPSAIPIGTMNTNFMGTALAGLEYPGVYPGTEGVDYFKPTAQNFTDIAGAGMGLVRLPFKWERLQPLLNGALDLTYLGYLTTAATNAGANGIKVIFDMHNYGRRYVTSPGGFTSDFAAADTLWTGGTIGSGVLTVSNFGSTAGGDARNPVSPADSYIYTTDVRITARNGDAWNAAWLVFHKSASTTFLAFAMHPVENTWELIKRVSGVDTVLADGALTVDLDTTYNVVIDVGQTSAGNIKVTVDTNLITTTAIPSGFTGGQIGLFTNGVTAWIDNVTLNIDGDTTSGRAGTGEFDIGNANGYLTKEHFADFYSRFSQVFKDNVNVLGYDLMNEWRDMYVPLTPSTYNSTATSTLAQQAATDAIRATGDTKYIIWEWDSYSNLHRGPGVAVADGGLFGTNPTKWWRDALNKVVVSGHYYYDPNHSGAYAEAYSATSLTRLAGEVTPTLAWARDNGVKLLIGETDVPNTDVGYLSCFSAAYALFVEYGAWVTQWASGDTYGANRLIATSYTGRMATIRLSLDTTVWSDWLKEFYIAITNQLINTGQMIGFNYWGGWEEQNTSIVNKTGSGASSQYSLNFRGNILKDFFLGNLVPYSKVTKSTSSVYTSVAKATSSVYTRIAKPT